MANLKKYINHDGKWRFVPVAKVKGVPRPTTVLIDGKPTKSDTGTFYLEWRENGKRIQRPVGTSPNEALDAWRNPGITSLPSPASPHGAAEEPQIPTANGTPITDAIATFLAHVKATKSDATHRAYDTDLRWFSKHINRQSIHDVTRDDILRLMRIGRDEELNQKSTNKRLIVALMALRNAGSDLKLKKGDWPKTVNKKTEAYDGDELKAFFTACDDRERLLFQTFLLTGFRSREMSTLRWQDIDFKRGMLTVCPRPEFDFTPKSYEERAVPVPVNLIQALRKHQKSAGECALVFPTASHPTRPNYGGGLPDAHHLELCKEIAHRAKLNCGRCSVKAGKCKNGPFCERWYLHKFRHTFATQMHRSGLDIRSLQLLLGHKNIATTEKYLHSLKLDDIRGKVESSSLAGYIS